MRRLAPALVAALALTGCTTDSAAAPAPEATGSFATCAGLASGVPPTPAKQVLPAIQIPCFDGSSTVHVDQVKGPAVINLWAPWCPPCREELPAFVRLAAQPGAPKVIGVVSSSVRPASVSVAEELGVTFPNLFDGKGRLGAELGIGVLPATLFVDEQGRITKIYRGVALTDETLGALVESQL